jgi:hypothetical protein
MSSGFVIAQETPGLPMIIQGDIMINGDSAPTGTLVSAKINNEVIKEYTLTEPRKYILTISNEEFEGENMDIYVNDVLTNQTITLESGQIVDADLNIEVKTETSKLFIIILSLILILLLVIIIVIKKNH